MPNINNNNVYHSVDGGRTACRHLAAAQLFYNKNTRQASYLITLFSPQNEPFLYNNCYDHQKLLCNAKHYHLFNINDIGSLLSELSVDIKINNTKGMLFCSHNHAMAIKIKNKGQRGYVVQFYEPNKTLVHKQILFPDIESITTLSFNDLLSDKEKEFFFNNSYGFLAIDLQKNKPSEQYFHIEKDIPIIEQLNFSLELGYTFGVKQAINEMLTEALTIEEQFNLLNCTFVSLTSAHYYNHSETIKFYISYIANSKFNNEQKEILLANLTEEMPVLFLAMQDGYTEIVSIYVDTILGSDLTDPQKISLLTAICGGTPGLFMALQDGKTKTVEVVINAVLSTNFTNEQKSILLSACDEGTPGLFVALQNGHFETVEIYINFILHSNLDEHAKANLFMAKAADNENGWEAAFKEGHHQIINFFVNAITQSNYLSETHKKNLLGNIILLNQQKHTNKIFA